MQKLMHRNNFASNDANISLLVDRKRLQKDLSPNENRHIKRKQRRSRQKNLMSIQDRRNKHRINLLKRRGNHLFLFFYKVTKKYPTRKKKKKK